MIFENQFSKSNPMVWRRHSLEGENPCGLENNFSRVSLESIAKQYIMGFWEKVFLVMKNPMNFAK